MHRLSYLHEGQWLEHSHPACYSLPTANEPVRRLVAGGPSKPAVFERLVGCLRPPYAVLYVLHTLRGESEPGRYQSPLLSSKELHAFLSRFESYFEADSRFDLWAHSSDDDGTVVWDRHNLLHVYGPVDRFAAELDALGFRPGSVVVPVPHAHHFRPECDVWARELLGALDWSRSPLEPEDEQ